MHSANKIDLDQLRQKALNAAVFMNHLETAIDGRVAALELPDLLNREAIVHGTHYHLECMEDSANSALEDLCEVLGMSYSAAKEGELKIVSA